MSLLACQNVSFAYEGKIVLSEVNFEVNPGDYLCIVGENGAGKSTLMKGMLNLKKPTSGSIVFGDGLNANEIGYLPQQSKVQKDFPASVYEVVLSGRLNHLGRRLFYSKQDKEIARSKMERVNILDLKNCCFRDLSGGQQQRVLLARALCATEKILLLDEPVTGLDPMITMEMYQMIRELNEQEGITIIMISHDVKEAVSYASHVLHIDKKQLFFGNKEDYFKSSCGHYFLAGGSQV